MAQCTYGRGVGGDNEAVFAAFDIDFVLGSWKGDVSEAGHEGDISRSWSVSVPLVPLKWRTAPLRQNILNRRGAMGTSIKFGWDDRKARVCDIAELCRCSACGTSLGRDDKGCQQLPALKSGSAVGCRDGSQIKVRQGRRGQSQKMEQKGKAEELHCHEKAIGAVWEGGMEVFSLNRQEIAKSKVQRERIGGEGRCR